MTIAHEDSPDDQDSLLSIGEESAAEPAAEAKYEAPVQVKNYELAKNMVREITEEEKAKFDGDTIHVSSDMASVIDSMVDQTAYEVDANNESMEFYTNLLQSFDSHPANGIFEDVLSDPKADWRNVLKYNGKNINIGRPNFKNQGRSNGQMSSERLMLSVQSRMGMGAPLQTQLMGSGFYVTHKPLGENEIIGLWREIIAETVRLGRATHGLIFSNNQSFTAMAVARSFVQSMIETTVSDLKAEDIFEHITINDLPAIACAQAAAIYPNGFPMSRPVFTEKNNLPKEERSQMLDLSKALVMNSPMFNDAQLEHMTKRIGKPMTLKSVKEYREQFTFNQDHVIDIGNDVRLHLHTPSLAEYFRSGEKWVNEVVTITRQALGDNPSEKDRAAHISRLAKASRLRQYAHYIKAIEDGGELYTTRDNIDVTLRGLSADDSVARQINKEISEYINRTQVAIVATTSVTEYEDSLTGNKWPRLIPLDPISIFFQLVELKLRGITSRALEGM